jgi:hypothetical protein
VAATATYLLASSCCLAAAAALPSLCMMCDSSNFSDQPYLGALLLLLHSVWWTFLLDAPFPISYFLVLTFMFCFPFPP